MKNLLNKGWRYVVDFLNWNERFTDEYSDTLALFLVSVGGVLAAVAIGVLPEGGTTNGYSFVYLKYPVLLREGLIAVVLGFIIQLSDNLTRVHKLGGRRISLLLIFLWISLTIMALFA
jgi:hypothetical protein